MYIGLSVMVVGILLLFHMYRKAHTDVIDRQVLSSEFLPASFREINIFFLSDIHRRTLQEETLSKVTDSIDLVIIGGDLIEKGVRMENVKQNITKLKKWGAPVYFIWGNNDYEGDYHELDATLLSLGVHILGNTAANLESAEGEKISILGVDFYHHPEENLKYAYEDATGEFKVLVIHDPAMLQAFSSEQKNAVHLVLSGHTHGGQIRLFGWGPMPKGGLKKDRDTPVFVSEGYGTRLLPLRLGTQAECHVITIKSVK